MLSRAPQPVSGEEIAAALMSLNVDPDAERIRALQAQLSASVLPDGERAAAVLRAVQHAHAALAGAPARGDASDVPVWTADDSRIADAQGWNLFNFDEAGRGEIQRDDETAHFETDGEAIAFVSRQARKGNAVAVRALAIAGGPVPAVMVLPALLADAIDTTYRATWKMHPHQADALLRVLRGEFGDSELKHAVHDALIAAVEQPQVAAALQGSPVLWAQLREVSRSTDEQATALWKHSLATVDGVERAVSIRADLDAHRFGLHAHANDPDREVGGSHRLRYLDARTFADAVNEARQRYGLSPLEPAVTVQAERRELAAGDAVGARRWPYQSAHPDVWGTPWQGTLLALNDPRAWAGHPALTSQPAIDQHIAWCHEHGSLKDTVPVLWDFGDTQTVFFQSAAGDDRCHALRPYADDCRDWEAARAAAYHALAPSQAATRAAPAVFVAPVVRPERDESASPGL